MRFSYQFFRGFYYPIIPVVLIRNEKKVNASAVVDSGATIPIFNANIAIPIGLDVESGKKHIFQGASAKLTGYIHKVKLVIAEREFECEVAFSDELSTSFNLLGRKGIFDNFKVCFNETERYVEFIPK